MTLPRFMTALAIAISLGACDTQPAEDAQLEEPAASPEPDETVSILRPDIEQPDLPEPAIQPFATTIGFPQGGAELDAAAQEALRKLLMSEALAQGGLIVLGGHSDAGGNGGVNERASRARAEAVRDWLIDNGVAKNRIEVIAFGEQNPVEPNALPDGLANEAGRAANRRVEVLVRLPEGEADSAEAASAETGD